MINYLQRFWGGVLTILIGMRVTFKHMFVPAVTIQYPTVRPELPERERNRLYVNMDDCIGCDQCSRACPVSCIDIETVKSIPVKILVKLDQESLFLIKSIRIMSYYIICVKLKRN